MVSASQSKAIIADRQKNGQCIHCGIQTHKIVKKGFLKDNERIPLTLPRLVEHGRCMNELCQQAGVNMSSVTKEDQEEAEDNNNNRLSRISQGMGVAAQGVILGSAIGGFIAVCMGETEVAESLQGVVDAVSPLSNLSTSSSSSSGGGDFSSSSSSSSSMFMGSNSYLLANQQLQSDTIPAGTVVSFKGLQSQPKRNGDRGEIQDYDETSGRYIVQLEDSEEFLRVKPSNLLQHVHVTLQGIESQPELNGKRGTIIAWNDHKGRYQIYCMDMAKVLSLRPTNVILENGTVGHIVGLQAKPQLNGKFGTIKSWDRASNRYDVCISADQILRLKAENVRV